MLANVRPVGRDYRFTPSHAETVAGCLTRPPKSPARVTFAPRCASTGRAKEGRQVRRDDSLEIIPMYTPKTETPRPGKALGAGQSRDDDTQYAKPASNRNWWGRQACTCRGAGTCLCCRRFDRAIRAHQVRVSAAGAC